MQNIEKWFGRWDTTHMLRDASIDSFVNKAFLQAQCILSWEESVGSHFSHYTTYVEPNYKTIFFAKWGDHTRQYILEFISLSII